jgi:hypothetical protein
MAMEEKIFLNPLETSIYIIYKTLVPALQKNRLCLHYKDQLMLHKEITSVDCEDHMKDINTLHGQNSLSNVIAGGVYNNHWALKGLSNTKAQ